MSILNIAEDNIEDSQDPVVIEADEEKEIRILELTQDINKKGNPYLLPRFEVVDEPMAKEFTRYLGLPHDDLSAKQLNSCKNQLKKFFTAFDIDVSADIDLEDCVGAQTWVILGVSDDEEYGEQNYIKRYVNPS